MKIVLIIIIIIIGFLYINNKYVHVGSYTKSDGTFVKEHYRSKP